MKNKIQKEFLKSKNKRIKIDYKSKRGGIFIHKI